MKMTANVSEQIKQHYLLEKRLAQRIVTSSPKNRTRVSLEAYNELFSRITWHPQLLDDERTEQERIREKQLLFDHLLDTDSDILDIGAGTGYWTRYLAKRGSGRCVGIDISEKVLVRRPEDPPNLEFFIMNAVELDFPATSFDIALSSQLIEHLHPDDVGDHFASVYRVLKKDGMYAFDTLNRLTGPHDISKYFDDVASGFHLKEWTYRELAKCLKKAGFRKMRTMILPWNWVKRFPRLYSLGTVPVSFLTPGEILVEKIKHKQTRRVFCKLVRVNVIFFIAQK